jgi:hypothetical protein
MGTTKRSKVGLNVILNGSFESGFAPFWSEASLRSRTILSAKNLISASEMGFLLFRGTV